VHAMRSCGRVKQVKRGQAALPTDLPPPPFRFVAVQCHRDGECLTMPWGPGLERLRWTWDLPQQHHRWRERE
jgi:hypothetical protein